MNQQAAKNNAAKSAPHASTYFPLRHSARGGLHAVIKPIRRHSGHPACCDPTGDASDEPADDASDEASDDASDNNAVVSFLRVDPGSHLSEAGVRHRDSRPRARSSLSLLWFGDLGLVQECGGLTEQLFECVSAAFGKNAFNVCIREGLTRCVQQAVTLQVLIMRISKTRQRKRQQIHDTDDKGKQTSSPEQEAEECGSSDLL